MVSEPRCPRPVNGSARRGRVLDADRARALAETLHRGQRDAGGAPLIDHVRRVASAVPPEASVVARPHEVLEHTPLSEEALLMEGLAPDALRALRLLTRDKDSRSSSMYLAHIELLAAARGAGAGVAQSVKRADLIDRARHPSIRPDGWSPPYELGLDVLQRGSARPAYPPSRLVRETRAPTIAVADDAAAWAARAVGRA